MPFLSEVRSWMKKNKASGVIFCWLAKCTDFPPVGEGHSSRIDDNDDDDDVLLMPKGSVPSAVPEEFLCN